MFATSSTIPVVDTKTILSTVTDRSAQLELIQALTHKMLEMAGQQQWENVSKLEVERSHLIYSFFETKPSMEEAEHVANTILEVLAVDKEIMALSSSAQQEILNSSQKINRGKQASQAYTMSKK